MEKPATTTVPLHPLLAGRWSARAFDGERGVDARTLRGLLEAATWAPSAGNSQPWRFVSGRRGAEAASDARWQAIYAALDPGNQRWCVRSAALIVALARRSSDAGKPMPWAWHDVGAAGLALALQAHAVGLHSHPMAGYDGAALRRGLGLPAELDVVTVWAVGYPGDPDALPEDLRGRELAPRRRSPLDELLLDDALPLGVPGTEPAAGTKP